MGVVTGYGREEKSVQKRTQQVLILVAVVLVLAVVAGILVAGKGGTGSRDANSALGNLEVAQSALATAAPDARLLVVQMMESVPTTGTPYWAYLFGSPSTDIGYVVYASAGEIMTWSEYGALGLTEDEWASVPDAKAWKVDSNQAYEKALKASGATGTPLGYFMGFVTYKSTEDTSTIQPFQWNIWLDPGTSGATENLIIVDAKTGKTTVTDTP